MDGATPVNTGVVAWPSNAREMSGSASVRGCSSAVTLSEVGLVGGPP